MTSKNKKDQDTPGTEAPESETGAEPATEAPETVPEAAPEADTDDALPDEAAPPEADADAETGAGTGETGDEAADDAPEAEEAEQLEAQEEDPEAKIADLNDKLLRALAETENMRRRAQRDKEDATKYAIANFAREMLSVGDNLKRAMDSVDAETRKNDPAVEQIMVGLEMTEREIQTIFKRFGIKTIQALGQKFDHNQHEAMFEVDDATKPAGTVVQEVETGFMLHDRLLRPAKVGVSKGGPKENGGAENAAPATPAPDEAAQKDGQAAYEDKGGDPGAQLDEEL